MYVSYVVIQYIIHNKKLSMPVCWGDNLFSGSCHDCLFMVTVLLKVSGCVHPLLACVESIDRLATRTRIAAAGRNPPPYWRGASHLPQECSRGHSLHGKYHISH